MAGVSTETATSPTPPSAEVERDLATAPGPVQEAVAVPAPPREDASEVAPLRLVVVSGMSGAGRSTTADNLEDLGWYVVDNLPPSVLPDVCDEARRTGIRQLAVVLDVRTRSFFEQLPTMFADLKEAGTIPEIVYVEASDDVIVRRQESVRRPHPLQGDGRLLDGIHRERELLATLRAAADLVIDTSSLNVHQLGSRITHAYGGPDHALRVTILSFGFKNGIPLDADMIFDVRFLPNPHWVPELRPQTGLSAPVSAYVLGQPGASPFLASLEEVLTTVASGYLHEGKRFATIGIGCTGGKHRSTAIAEELARRLRADGLPTTVLHRDLGRV
jgi:RNase adapter protein RapZ